MSRIHLRKRREATGGLPYSLGVGEGLFPSRKLTPITGCRILNETIRTGTTSPRRAAEPDIGESRVRLRRILAGVWGVSPNIFFFPPLPR